jgi:hypothetical protein
MSGLRMQVPGRDPFDSQAQAAGFVWNTDGVKQVCQQTSTAIGQADTLLRDRIGPLAGNARCLSALREN